MRLHLFLCKCSKSTCRSTIQNDVFLSLISFSALNIVYQRNGDGEAKSPACRAGVREAVLHTVKQGTRFPSQVVPVM